MKTVEMGWRLGRRRRTILAIALGGFLLSFSLPSAHAERGSAPVRLRAPAVVISKMDFAYAAPEIPDSGDRVIWRWTLRNTGTVQAKGVVVTHYLSPSLPILYLSEKCTANATKTVVKCSYGTMQAGERRTGSVVVGLPEDFSGNIQISGKVTWTYTTARRTTVTRTIRN